PDIIETLNHGVEGYHWEWVDGARKPIDEDRNSQDLWVFGYGDLEIIQQGVTPPQTVDDLIASLQNHEVLTTDELRREYAEARIEYRKLITEIGTTQHVLDVPRPVNDKLGPQIGKSLAEG